MKKLLLSIALALLPASNCLALSDAAIPTKIPTSWAQSAPGANVTCPIPIPSQISISAGRASWTDGFPPVTFLPSSSGGVPPVGQDFNGAFCQISQWIRWSNAGAPIFYDATFQSAIGGYPNGAVLQSNVNPYHLWVSTVDNNNSNPESGGANWLDVGLMTLGGGWGGTSGGTANVQTILIPGWGSTNLTGVPIQFFPGVANTSAATLQINAAPAASIRKKTLQGLQVLTGGELQTGQIASVTFDGSVYELQQQTSIRLNLVTIAFSQTYTPSAGTTTVDVTCIGGGGGGGGSATTGASQAAAGGGGGGGGIASGIFTFAQISPNVSVTIGTGGLGNIGAAGSAGLPTSFGSLLVSGGGAGGGTTGLTGPNSSSNTGFAGGGAATTGPIKLQGQYGGNAQIIFSATTSTSVSGGGGAGIFGGAGGQGQTTVAGASNGTNAIAPGSGAGGGVNGPSQSATIGGTGASGYCVIKELIAQ